MIPTLYCAIESSATRLHGWSYRKSFFVQDRYASLLCIDNAIGLLDNLQMKRKFIFVPRVMERCKVSKIVEGKENRWARFVITSRSGRDVRKSRVKRTNGPSCSCSRNTFLLLGYVLRGAISRTQRNRRQRVLCLNRRIQFNNSFLSTYKRNRYWTSIFSTRCRPESQQLEHFDFSL